MAILEGRRLAKEAGVTGKESDALECICSLATNWPASAEMAACAPGTKIRLNEYQAIQLSFGVNDVNVPGKLTFCATCHKTAYKALTRKQLKKKYVLPCGQVPTLGKSKGIPDEITHPPIEASLKDLSLREMQQCLCTGGCNSHDDVRMETGKAILSDVFYSYCLERVCNANDLPGSVVHCIMYGLCRNYMYGHCMRCNKCSYGSKGRTLPCMHCHDLVLLHDGFAFVPVKHGQCPAGQLVGIAAYVAECMCGNGEVLFNDPSPPVDSSTTSFAYGGWK
jgi:hypothetical protein